MCNHHNPVSGIHPSTFTLLTSETKHYYQWDILYTMAGGKGTRARAKILKACLSNEQQYESNGVSTTEKL